LTPDVQPASVAPALRISQELINRLIALKSLLALGDMELVGVASSRLESSSEEPEIGGILASLKDHRYADALGLIDKLLSDGTRLASWTDPEIALLEAELERVKAELADLETELAELERLVARFQTAHNEALGARIAKLLKLRIQILESQLEAEPNKRTAYDQASRDFQDFQRDRDIQKEEDARTKWELSAGEQMELKRLFRQGSKLCHPDVAAAEHHEAAAEMFRQFRKSYDEGNLARLRQLLKSVQAGLFVASDDTRGSDERRKEHLKAKIAGIREALAKTQTNIHDVQRSSTYQTMTVHADWGALFESQARLLDQEIESLAAKLEETRDDNA
jgi:hypothetical protein